VSDEVIRTCPYCGRERKLYVNRRRRLYHCFVCQASGRVSELPWVEPYSPGKTPEVVSTPPPRCHPLSREAHDYLVERGVNYGYFDCVSETARGLLFRFPDSTYWQERRWEGKPRWRSANGGEGPSTGITFHLSPSYVRPCERAKRVAIVEGIFDALKVVSSADHPAAAVLSNRIHPRQVKFLSSRYKEAIYLPDNDGTVSLKLQAETLCRLSEGGFERVHRIVLPYKDPGEAPREELRSALA